MTKTSGSPASLIFRQALPAALAQTDPDQRLRRLADLALPDLDLVEIIKLDRAVRQTAGATAQGFARVRLAVLSDCTIEQLLPAIRIAGLRRGLLIETYGGGFGQYRQELLHAGSPLHGFRPDSVLLSLSSRGVLAGVPPSAAAAAADHALDEAVDELRSLWRKARDDFHATVMQQSFLDTSEPLFGSLDRLVPGAPFRLTARLNDRLADAAAEEGVAWLDIARASARDGIHAWFDVARWLQGKMEVAPQAAPRYGELLSRLLAAQRGQSRKCLVLDLDNTLWGGVIGDDGLEGIVLGQGSATGEAHLALQHYARLLRDRGVILAVCSRNDLATAEAVFRDHPEMALARSDFAAFVVNWNDKAENLRLIARELNIGVDSLVFVDDNPAERARVRESLPMVAVPELPPDAAHYVSCIADAGYFEAASFTAEDRRRAGDYAANAGRAASRELAQSLDEFLQGLGMSVSYGPVAPVDLPRVTQLLNKTNQFNPTTRRYPAADLALFCAAPENIALQFRLADRFGDNGLVSVMLLRPAGEESDVMEIDNWVMSCRVFGRQLEAEAMNIAVEIARARGIRAFRAEYIPTPRNSVICDLYESLGFSRLSGPAAPEQPSQWLLALRAYAPPRTFIDRRALT